MEKDNNTLSLLKFETSTKDECGKTWTISGSLSISTIENKKCVYFNGNSYLYYSGNILSGCSDFTIEWFEYRLGGTSIPTVFCTMLESSGYNGIAVQSLEGTHAIYYDDSSSNRLIAGGNAGITINKKWIHWAISRIGKYIRCFRNGKLQSVFEIPFNVGGGSKTFIGVNAWSKSSYLFQGYISDFRISNIGRYSEDFEIEGYSIETHALGYMDKGNFVKSLLHFDSSAIKDEAGNTWSTVGSPIVSSQYTKFGNSLYLNGSSYLKYNGNILSGLKRFTIEWWEYRFSSSLAMPTIFCTMFESNGYNGLAVQSREDYHVLFYDDINSNRLVSGSIIGTSINNAWSHYAVVRDNDYIKCFQDGKKTFETYIESELGGKEYTFIGVNAWNKPDFYFTGCIDEFRILTVAKSLQDFDLEKQAYKYQVDMARNSVTLYGEDSTSDNIYTPINGKIMQAKIGTGANSSDLKSSVKGVLKTILYQN